MHEIHLSGSFERSSSTKLSLARRAADARRSPAQKAHGKIKSIGLVYIIIISRGCASTPQTIVPEMQFG
jgi:hypothetical protein